MSSAATKTAALRGYAMPAEWEPHEAIWLSWPHDTVTFPRLPSVEGTYTQIIKAIHESELVRLLVKDEPTRARVSKLLSDAKVDPSRVEFLIADYADVWFRDYGPTFVLDAARKTKAMVHWIFNAWGGKYEELLKDTHVPELIEKRFGYRRARPGIVLEGGSIEVNGAGVVMTTEQCLLHPNRNPSLNRRQIEETLRAHLGTESALWLKEGILGDDTDGHIDDIARFVAPDTIACAVEDDPQDGNYRLLRENWELLEQAKDARGRKFKLIKLPMPGVVADGKTRLPASYANFYIGTTVVLAPVFGHRNDAAAVDTLKQCFPGRKVAPIPCNDLVFGLGTLHCISQQEPKV